MHSKNLTLPNKFLWQKGKTLNSVLSNIKDFTTVVISYEDNETSRGEFHKFDIKGPQV